MMKPTSGIPTTTAQKPARAIDSFSKKRRRLISAGASTPSEEWSAMFSFITNFCDPSGERCGEEDKTDNENDPRRDQTPEEKCCSHCQPGSEISGMRQRFRRQGLPIRMRARRWFVRHAISTAARQNPIAGERGGPELPRCKSKTFETTSTDHHHAALTT